MENKTNEIIEILNEKGIDKNTILKYPTTIEDLTKVKMELEQKKELLQLEYLTRRYQNTLEGNIKFIDIDDYSYSRTGR